MGYVAVKGGEDAIERAAALVEYYRCRDPFDPVSVDQLRSQFRALIDRAMGEGSLYAPDHAALALKQSEGDTFEAAFLLRAYRATLERRYESSVLDTRGMWIERRISSAFREIPGGQILGPTRDYTHRLLEPSLAGEDRRAMRRLVEQALALASPLPANFSAARKVVDLLIDDGLMRRDPSRIGPVVDVTRDPIRFPAPRSAVLQMLARAETGALMSLGYSGMRGFGGDHGTVGELRVGLAAVEITDHRGRQRFIGRVRVTECEMVGQLKNTAAGVPYLEVGYGLCFGHNDTKAIAMGMLDSALREGDPSKPAMNQEYVLYHTECVEAYGFTNHLKLPHYVTFQSGIDNLREILRRKSAERRAQAAEFATTAEGR
jgi:alpha-D-ribose 1-methylphosphonate 5-triphosphate synthase subunit PhnI